MITTALRAVDVCDCTKTCATTLSALPGSG